MTNNRAALIPLSKSDAFIAPASKSPSALAPETSARTRRNASIIGAVASFFALAVWTSRTTIPPEVTTRVQMQQQQIQQQQQWQQEQDAQQWQGGMKQALLHVDAADPAWAAGAEFDDPWADAPDQNLDSDQDLDVDVWEMGTTGLERQIDLLPAEEPELDVDERTVVPIDVQKQKVAALKEKREKIRAHKARIGVLKREREAKLARQKAAGGKR